MKVHNANDDIFFASTETEYMSSNGSKTLSCDADYKSQVAVELERETTFDGDKGTWQEPESCGINTGLYATSDDLLAGTQYYPAYELRCEYKYVMIHDTQTICKAALEESADYLLWQDGMPFCDVSETCDNGLDLEDLFTPQPVDDVSFWEIVVVPTKPPPSRFIT